MEAKRRSTKTNTKQALLDAGLRSFLAHGYYSTGVEEVLQAVGAPRGSFYHYFKNKEDFGLQVLDQAWREQETLLDQYLADQGYTPLARLQRYLENGALCLEGQECRFGCVIGNLSQELAAQNEAFRAQLDAILSRWCERIARCIEEAQQAGEVNADYPARDLAEFVVSGWQGALLRAKAARDSGTARIYIQYLFDRVLTR